METNTTNAMSLIRPEAFKALISTAPAILENNRTSVQKAKEAGQTILDTIEAAGMSAELDQKANEYQVKVKKTYETIQESRKPITQLLDEVKKSFTILESEIDPKNSNSIFTKVQVQRNIFAQAQLEEQKKANAEIQRKLNVDKEKASVRSQIDIALSNEYNQFLTNKLNELSNLFNSATLANIDETAQLIISFSEKYPEQHLKSISLNIPTIYLTIEETAGMIAEVKSAKLDQLSTLYAFDIQSQKEGLSLRVPARKNELKAIADTQASASAAALAASKASAENAERLNAEAAEFNAESDRIKAEADKRQEAEGIKLAEEAKEREVLSIAAAESNKQAENMQNLFDATADAAPGNVAAKEAYEIDVLNPSAYLLLAQFWFEKEGMKASADEIEKKTFKQMKTFCEKHALKTEDKIKSAYIVYKEVAKATVKK